MQNDPGPTKALVFVYFELQLQYFQNHDAYSLALLIDYEKKLPGTISIVRPYLDSTIVKRVCLFLQDGLVVCYNLLEIG